VTHPLPWSHWRCPALARLGVLRDQLRRLGRISPMMGGWLATSLPLLIYQLLTFTAFFPITEGWFSTYGHLIRHGAIPHRDFNLLIPPLYPLQIALIQALFGENILILRGLGILVTCGIGIALYEVLRGPFNRWVAAFSAATAIIYYQSGNAFIGYDFTQFLTLYILIGSALLVRFVDGTFAGTPERDLQRLAGAAGFFLGLAVLIKQSNGGLTALCAGLTFGIIALRVTPMRHGLRHLAWFAIGGCGPTALVLLWLASRGALGAFFDQVVFAAIAAKGGQSAVFLGWVHGFFGGQYPLFAKLLAQRLLTIGAAIAGPIVVYRLVVALAQRKIASPESLLATICGRAGPRGWPLECSAPVLCGLAIASLCGLIVYIYVDHCGFCLSRRDNIAIIYNSVILLSIHVYLIGFLVCLFGLFLKPTLGRTRFLVIFAIGVGLTIGNGTSAGFSEISAFLGLAVVLAALMQWSLPYVLPTLVPVTLSLSLSGYLIEKKFETPYYWWSVVSTDVRKRTCAKAAGLLRGLCVEPRKYDKIQLLVSDIRARAGPGEAIYVFPHLPIFYLLADRPPFAGAVVSWFDFMSDEEAETLKTKLASEPPRVLLVARLPDEVYTAHERLFRGGRPSNQRGLVDTINELVRADALQHVDTVTDLDGLTISVFARPARKE